MEHCWIYRFKYQNEANLNRMNTTPQDDCLIVAALARFSNQFKDADEKLADRAWELAVEIADEHGLEPSDAVRQLEGTTPNPDSFETRQQ